MLKRQVVTLAAALVTFAASAQLLSAQQAPPEACQENGYWQMIFLGNECPWNIGAICEVNGISGPGTDGDCIDLGEIDGVTEAYLVTCTCWA